MFKPGEVPAFIHPKKSVLLVVPALFHLVLERVKSRLQEGFISDVMMNLHTLKYAARMLNQKWC